MESITEFSGNYLQKVFSDSPNENVATSPLSLVSLLYLLWVGARGSTQSSIASTMKINSLRSPLETQQEFEKIFNKLNNDPLLKSATKIFLNQAFNVTAEFEPFVQSFDFNDVAHVTRSTNAWIESYTNGKIKKLVDENMIQPETIMVLLNALYFKGLWKDPFTFTREDDFQNIDGSKSRVTFMSEIFRYRHANLRDLNAEVLELPYQNSDIVMLICLPNSPNGIQDLIKKFPTVQKRVFSTPLEAKYLSATLPRFKIESSLRLNRILKQLGMGEAFTDRADFRNMLKPGSGSSKVSSVVQKTFVEVDEKGTESASGSGAFIIPRMSLEDFNCEHPFMFFIYHRTLNIPIIAGVVRNL
ncbi:serpin B3-like [Culicoides brevitarsis]|uniref:serpin B3-like n=1 Tax=Culicoides brevitarsis TaxID=469753 RepID=UPI00307B9798